MRDVGVTVLLQFENVCASSRNQEIFTAFFFEANGGRQ